MQFRVWTASIAKRQNMYLDIRYLGNCQLLQWYTLLSQMPTLWFTYYLHFTPIHSFECAPVLVCVMFRTEERQYNGMEASCKIEKQKNYKIEIIRPKGVHGLPWSQLVTLLSRVHVWANAYLILFNLWYAPWHVVQQSPWFRDSHSQEGFSHCTWSHSTIPSLHLHCLQFSIVIDCPSANEELPISHRNVVAEKR